MPHTQMGGMSEVALLAYLGDLRWGDLGTATGVAPSAQRDADGHAVYASFYFVGIDGFPEAGLGVFGPDDTIDIVSTLERYGRSMLDGEHFLYRAGTLPAELPATLPPAPRVRLSNVIVREGRNMDDLRSTWPANANLDDVPVSADEPDSYRLIKLARQTGRFGELPGGASPLWVGRRSVRYPIDADRDVNGVGLVYFANYVAILDWAERQTLVASGGYSPEALDGRRTRWGRLGFYRKAPRHD